MDNVVISPHSASTVVAENRLITELFCDNLRRWLGGEPLLNVYRPDLGYRHGRTWGGGRHRDGLVVSMIKGSVCMDRMSAVPPWGRACGPFECAREGELGVVADPLRDLPER